MTASAASAPLVISWTPIVDHFVLYSLHDQANIGDLCTLIGGFDFRFISATEIGYVTNSSSNDPVRGTSTIGRMNLADLEPHVVATVQGDVLDVTWSPDGSSVAYLLYTANPGLGSGAANQLWLQTGDAPPRALTPLIPLFGRGGSISDETIVRFSHDGKYLLMVDTYVNGPTRASLDQVHFQVREMPAGTLVWAPADALVPGDKIGSSFHTMAAWSHTSDRLYYRDAAGVHSWDPPSTVATIAAGLAWFSPSVSADDRFVAYTVNLDSKPQVEVRDLVNSKVRVLPGVRASPLFLWGSTLVEAAMEPNNQPRLGTLPYKQTGNVLFDMDAGVETPVFYVIDPIDYWPH